MERTYTTKEIKEIFGLNPTTALVDTNVYKKIELVGKKGRSDLWRIKEDVTASDTTTNQPNPKPDSTGGR